MSFDFDEREKVLQTAFGTAEGPVRYEKPRSTDVHNEKCRKSDTKMLIMNYSLHYTIGGEPQPLLKALTCDVSE